MSHPEECVKPPEFKNPHGILAKLTYAIAISILIFSLPILATFILWFFFFRDSVVLSVAWASALNLPLLLFELGYLKKGLSFIFRTKAYFDFLMLLDAIEKPAVYDVMPISSDDNGIIWYDPPRE